MEYIAAVGQRIYVLNDLKPSYRLLSGWIFSDTMVLCTPIFFPFIIYIYKY